MHWIDITTEADFAKHANYSYPPLMLGTRIAIRVAHLGFPYSQGDGPMRKLCLVGSAFALVFATSAFGQNQVQQPQVTVQFPTPIYRMDNVSQNLKLNQEQITKLNELTTKMEGKYRTDFEKINTLPEKERAQRRNELYQRYNTEWMTDARNIFNDNQRTRYSQLYYQYDPYVAFSDAEVQRKLNLSDEQRTMLRSDLDWNNQQMQDIQRQFGTDKAAANKAYTTYIKERTNRLNKFLTPEQQRTWREMTGEPIEFQFTAPTPPLKNGR
jgi:hypothetical protein